MPTKIGSIIDGDNHFPIAANGFADAIPNPTTDGRTENGSNNVAGEPEVIRGYETIDPGSFGNSGDSDNAGLGTGFGDKPRRGRKPGSKNRPRDGEEKEVHQSLADLSGILLTGHAMLAALLKVREFELDPSEAKSLGEATKKVLEFYPLGLSGKNLAIVNLVFVASGIYGTRIMAYNIRRGMEKRGPAPNKVVAMPSPAAQQQSQSKVANGFPTPDFEMNPSVDPVRDSVHPDVP